MSTGLDKCLVERWRDTDGLGALVPVELVSSEITQVNESVDSDKNADGHFDDCVVFQVASDPHWRTNSGRGWKSQVKISCLSIDYDRSKLIAQTVETAWDSQSFTGSSSSITFTRSNGLNGTQDEATGVWDHTVSFEIHHTGV